MPRQGFRSISSRAMIGRALLPALVAVVAACGSPTPSRSPAASISMAPTPWSSPSASATATPLPSPTPSPTSGPTVFPIAVVVRSDDARPSITPQALTAAATAGQLLVPCEVTGLSLDGQALAIPATTTCQPAAQVATAIHTTAKIIGLLPPGLVSPSVKVLPIGLADLFGAHYKASQPYPPYPKTSPVGVIQDREMLRDLPRCVWFMSPTCRACSTGCTARDCGPSARTPGAGRSTS